MSSHSLLCLHHHMVQALKSRVPADSPGAAVGCPQVYRGISKLEQLSMSMTLSSLEPPTNLPMLHSLSSTWSSMKMWNSMEHSTMLVHTYLMIESSEPFWTCVEFSSSLIVYSSSPVCSFHLRHSSPVSMTSLYCFVKFRHWNCTPACVIIFLDFTNWVNLLFRTFRFLFHFCLTHVHLWSLNLRQKIDIITFPWVILLKYL